jgi:hypothetical protein
MKTIIVIATLAVTVGTASAQYLGNSNRGSSYGSSGLGYGTGSNPSSHQTQGYTTQSGSYAQPHFQTNPNNTQMDNYSTRGNLNPYTGAVGTRTPRY